FRSRPPGPSRESTQVKPGKVPVVRAGSGWVPKLSISAPKACAIDTSSLLFGLATKLALSKEHQGSLDGQSAGNLSRRPMRNLPPAPPASSVGTLRVLCQAGLPMSLDA